MALGLILGAVRFGLICQKLISLKVEFLKLNDGNFWGGSLFFLQKANWLE